MNRKISYEDISYDLENDERLTYYIDSDYLDYQHVISKLLTELDNFIKTEKLTDNDVKLGMALYDIFENYENLLNEIQ